MGGGIKKGYDTNAYTTPEIERIGRVGIELARKRDGRLTSVEKANVMHSGVLWRQVMTALHKAEGDGVQLSHMYADNCAMQLVRNPKQFDVIVTDNLFGDFYRIVRPCLPDRLACCHLHRLASQILKLAAKAMYEPVHGQHQILLEKTLPTLWHSSLALL